MGTSRNTSKLLINEYPLQVLPSLACAIGLNEALILQQVHYWLQLPSAHEHDGRRWIYNSYPSWQKQFPFWSVNTVRRAIEGLEDKGYLLSGNYNKRAMDKTKWYTIDYTALEDLPLTEWLDPFGNNARPSAHFGQTISSDWADDQPKMGKAIPETTTETNNRESDPPARPVAANISRKAPVTASRDMPLDKPVAATPLPDIYPLTDDMQAWARVNVPSLNGALVTEHNKFCAYYRSIAHDRKLGRRANWRPVWELWMTRQAGGEFSRKGGNPPPTAGPEPRMITRRSS